MVEGGFVILLMGAYAAAMIIAAKLLDFWPNYRQLQRQNEELRHTLGTTHHCLRLTLLNPINRIEMEGKCTTIMVTPELAEAAYKLDARISKLLSPEAELTRGQFAPTTTERKE